MAAISLPDHCQSTRLQELAYLFSQLIMLLLLLNKHNIHIWYEQETLQKYEYAVSPALRIPSHIFLETLPAKPVTTSCKNRFFRRQKTYNAMEVFIRWVNKLFVMTRRNSPPIWYFRHCQDSKPRPASSPGSSGGPRRDAPWPMSTRRGVLISLIRMTGYYN